MQYPPAAWAKASGPRLLTLAMVLTVALANVLMPYPLTPYVCWGTPVIALTFCINELAHRAYGAQVARQVVLQGFVAALALSLSLAPWRIAVASACAFLLAQLLDIYVFAHLRRASWWLAPLASSSIASTVDTAVFFALAFAGSATCWWHFAVGDWLCKLLFDLVLLLPFRLLSASRPRLTAAGQP